jgi:hypothetical protein
MQPSLFPKFFALKIFALKIFALKTSALKIFTLKIFARRTIVSTILMPMLLLLPIPAHADTPEADAAADSMPENRNNADIVISSVLEIFFDTPAFNNVSFSDGDIRVEVDYTPYNEGNYQPGNLIYDLYYQDQKYQTFNATTVYYGSFRFLDLDNDTLPELIVQTFSGGAHCCTNNLIYGWDERYSRFSDAETGDLDAGGGIFRDLNNDGQIEFVSLDNAFFYQFGAYAESFPPDQIFNYRNRTLVDTTRDYPTRLIERAQQMRASFLETKANGHISNAILAGYVAQSALISEVAYAEAWQFMLDNYDTGNDWGLEIYNNSGDAIGRYPDFPTALRAFLVETEYID